MSGVLFFCLRNITYIVFVLLVMRYQLFIMYSGGFMKRFLLFSFMFLLVVSISTFVFGQDNEDGDEKSSEPAVYTLGEILVKDTAEKPGVTSVVKKEDVEKSSKNDLVNVISENVPSFYTANNRIMGFGVADSGAATMSIRGIGVSGWSPQTGSGPTTGVPILINGMDVTMMINNHPVADIFSMKNIEKIEVLHGPQPVLYGSSAMGGIINVITKRRSKEGYETNMSASYGSYNTKDDHVSHYGKFGNFDYGVSYNFRYTDGHRDQEINGTTFTSEYMSNNGSSHFGYEFNKHWYVGLDSYIMKMDIHDPGAEGETSDELEVFDITRGGTVLQIGNTFNKVEGSLQLYGNWGRHLSTQPAYGDRDKYESYDSMYGAKLKETITPLDGTNITLGAEGRRYGGKSYDNVTGDDYTDDRYIKEGSGFGLVEQALFDRFFIISGGGRYTHNSEYGGYSAWQGGAIVNPFDTTKIHFQAARGFKVPDIVQYYNKWTSNDTTIKESDTDLKPETYTSYEIGVEQRIYDIIVFSITGYRIYSKNKFIKEIVGFNMDGGITEWSNADDFNYNGLESSFAISPIKIFKLSAGYSYIDHEYKNKILPYVPKHKFLSGATITVGRLMFNLNSQYVKDIYANEEEKTFGFGTVEHKKLDDYFVINAKITYTFHENYKLFANFNNITDMEYATYAIYKFPPDNKFLEYPMPGFHMLAGVSATF